MFCDNHMYRRIFYVLIAVFLYSNSEAGEFSFKGNKFAYRGHVIDTAFNITADNFLVEGGVLASVIKSSFNDLEVIKILSEEGKLELWLYNAQSKNHLLKIDSFPIEYKVDWASSKDLIASRSQMGLSTTYIYELCLPEAIKRSDPIKNLIYFDAKTAYFITYAPPDLSEDNDRIVVGKLFSDYMEIFNIKFDYKYMSDALGLFRGAKIEGSEAFVYVKQGGEIKTFEYELQAEKRNSGDSLPIKSKTPQQPGTD